MHYVSTRGEAPSLGFAEAMLAGLARDGGRLGVCAWALRGSRSHGTQETPEICALTPEARLLAGANEKDHHHDHASQSWSQGRKA